MNTSDTNCKLNKGNFYAIEQDRGICRYFIGIYDNIDLFIIHITDKISKESNVQKEKLVVEITKSDDDENIILVTEGYYIHGYFYYSEASPNKLQHFNINPV